MNEERRRPACWLLLVFCVPFSDFVIDGWMAQGASELYKNPVPFIHQRFFLNKWKRTGGRTG